MLGEPTESEIFDTLPGFRLTTVIYNETTQTADECYVRCVQAAGCGAVHILYQAGIICELATPPTQGSDLVTDPLSTLFTVRKYGQSCSYGDSYGELK